MNEILDWLLLIGTLAVGAVWITAVFCYVIMILGGYDD